MTAYSRSVPARTQNREARVRWLMGQLQRPPGRIPAERAAKLLAQKIDAAATVA